jgi:hypothetical protein
VTIWGLAGGAYGLVLALAALTQPIRQRHLAFAASLAYALASLGAGTLSAGLLIHLLAPAVLLLTGYWLSGLFFRDPQPWLEAWLLRIDHAVRAERWMARAGRPIAECLEFAYASVYPLIGGGALFAATFGTEAVADYWSLVVASTLASYAPLPWLRSRPPRAIEREASYDEMRDWIRAQPGPRAEGPPSAKPPSAQRPAARSAATLRRLNTLILDTASIQANTLPSGHVSGAVAAALGVMAVDAVVGWWMMVLAGLIAIAAVAGRYHYVVDCVAGAALALALSSLM